MQSRARHLRVLYQNVGPRRLYSSTSGKSQTTDETPITETISPLDGTKLAPIAETATTPPTPIAELVANPDLPEIPITPDPPSLEKDGARLLPNSSLQRARHLQSSKVPSSKIGRLFHYGGLAASLSLGAASEAIRRSTASSSSGEQGAAILTDANIKRLVSKLVQMRGAALKLGQFLSIQDTHVLPPEVDKIFRQVQDSAHYMPDWQMEQVLTTAVPSNKEQLSITRMPFASASIGQVHSGILFSEQSPTGYDARVAVKIQFPGVRESIESDLGYVSWLLTVGRALPKGLFLDRTLAIMKGELADECSYTREAQFIRKFRDALEKDKRYRVPWVWKGSTDDVLVMEMLDGVSVGDELISNLPQEDRDMIGSLVIELCLKELFEFRFMQTDPNWTNFLWNTKTRQLELVDFGATREYSKSFIDDWLRLLQAATAADRDGAVQASLKLGYLTGEESQEMVDTHVTSMILLATPFAESTTQPVQFGPGSQWSEVTAKIRSFIPFMLRNRLTPPPHETYSLNRKLSGAFLLAARLGATIDSRAIWEKVVDNYKF